MPDVSATADDASREEGASRELEIGHVLFVDIVGYSKHLLNEQTALVRRLNDLVRGTDPFKQAEAAGKLVTIPTGDGMALVFLTAPDAPVRCAMAINLADQEDPKIELRMGIHSGPVDRMVDVNDRANVTGAGINMAQRVMDCGDSGHILLSQRIGDDLGQHEKWRSYLHDLGEIEVKHGVRLRIVNFYSDLFGNAEVPLKLKEAFRHRQRQQRRKNMLRAAAALVIAALLLAGGYFFVLHRAEQTIRNQEAEIPAKSVAVLPLENLSPNEADAFLAGGLQDEIITQLSKIADLKVISRTSTLQYGTKPANLKQIAKELGVAAILEGSVQKVASTIRVNVQLIKATTDAHLWADTYDRELIDLLQVQSEVAQQITTALQATLTNEEKARIDAKATNNTDAYMFYLKGTEVLRRPAMGAAPMEEGQQYFEKAIALDPQFALAHARLAQLHTRIAAFFDPSPLHLEKALAEAKEALQLQPNLGEGHVALGQYHARITHDYEAALREYELAKRSAPNDPFLLVLIATAQRKSGQFRAAITNLERATALDPMNWMTQSNLGGVLSEVGLWPAAERAKRRAAEVTIGPEKLNNETDWSWVYYELTGSTEKVNEVIARYQGTNDSPAFLAMDTYGAAIVDRDYDRAEETIKKTPVTIFETFSGPRCTKKFLLGRVALLRGETEKARPLLEAELPFARSEVNEAPDSAVRHAQLGLILADLGRGEEAVAEGERAAALLPIPKDTQDGPNMVAALAEIYATVGKHDQAIALLEKLLNIPSGITQVALKEPNWDLLRNEPRFQKLVNGPPPKIEYH